MRTGARRNGGSWKAVAVRRFTQVDVFTDELTLGNPVAVVHDADELTTHRMADLARWTNLSETTFLSTPTDDRADYQVRIFTISRELHSPATPHWAPPMPGWRQANSHNAEMIIQQCGAGLIPIRRDGGRLAFAAPPLLRGGDVYSGGPILDQACSGC